MNTTLTLVIAESPVAIALTFCAYIIIRNERVYRFRLAITDLVFANFTNSKYALYKKHSYSKMLYSIKPLKLERFFTPEEIELLKS